MRQVELSQSFEEVHPLLCLLAGYVYMREIMRWWN